MPPQLDLRFVVSHYIPTIATAGIGKQGGCLMPMTIEDDDIEEQGGRLILAAEDCGSDIFSKIHKFSKYENRIILSLVAHGPVLIRGGRGSGKSALLLESYNRIQRSYPNVLGVYLSLRHLPLLRSQGEAYEKLFCQLLIATINDELSRQHCQPLDIADEFNVGDLQQALLGLSRLLSRRLVLLFDDAAHIGRETSLEEFFSIFRTISGNTVSCKAAIYPGVTHFGTRFDVYNDATVIDISRDEGRDDFTHFFMDVIEARYPGLLQKASPDLSQDNTLAWFLGRAVVGNMRALIFACNRLLDSPKINLPELEKCLKYLASEYYWPLLEEVSPKLGKYEPLAIVSIQLAGQLFGHAAKKEESSVTSIVVHRDLVQKYDKLFEILEYVGFVTRREASRAMKSGGRGVRFAINLCNLLEKTPKARLTSELLQAWRKNDEITEIYKNSKVIELDLPELPNTENTERLPILDKDISHIKKSKSYPYGLTDAKCCLLKAANINTIGELAGTTDKELLQLDSIGPGTVERIRNVVGQAVWM